jgi:hypothetical protein
MGLFSNATSSSRDREIDETCSNLTSIPRRLPFRSGDAATQPVPSTAMRSEARDDSSPKDRRGRPPSPSNRAVRYAFRGCSCARTQARLRKPIATTGAKKGAGNTDYSEKKESLDLANSFCDPTPMFCNQGTYATGESVQSSRSTLSVLLSIHTCLTLYGAAN